MKKIICLSLVLVLVLLCLPGCEALNQMVDNNAQSKAQVEQMLSALAEANQEVAMDLMHPSVDRQKAESAYSQMCAFMTGRKVMTLTATGLSINSSVGLGGKTEQESVSFLADLEDGTQIQITAIYLKNTNGEGFTSFQLNIGLA